MNSLKLRRALVAADQPMSGYELARAARVRSYVAYSELDRLLHAGAVVDGWGSGPHPRRFYMLAERASWVDGYGLRALPPRKPRGRRWS